MKLQRADIGDEIVELSIGRHVARVHFLGIDLHKEMPGGFQFEVQHPRTYIEGEHGTPLQPIERDGAQRSS